MNVRSASPLGTKEIGCLREWMAGNGWSPLPHQEESWAAQLAGRSGIVAVPTGMGKTYAAYFGALARAAALPRKGLRVLWVSPLRAMARDVEKALALPVTDLGWELTVASRTGDTSASQKRRLRSRPPEVLLTTPESLSLMLSYADAPSLFSSVDTVVVDEWHELCGTKRGTQTELALSRIRAFSPEVRTWALSATHGDVQALGRAAAGVADPEGQPLCVVRSDEVSPPELLVLEPATDDLLPWFGFIGTTMFDHVVKELDIERPTLVFTNTRNQAERWFRAIVERRPEWFEFMGLHHGSLDRAERERVEQELSTGRTRLVVCTSSLDLGVDFSPVQRVFQIGAVRSVSRLMQRAGRSGHKPGAKSELWLVPTHALQLVEFVALKDAVSRSDFEARRALTCPSDVLVQHMVTCALGGGFEPDAFFEEVRAAVGYCELTREHFEGLLDLVETGGSTLRTYPQYRRVTRDDAGRCVVTDRRVARIHRSSIGTIVSDGLARVRYLNGKSLGTVEERFVGRLHRGTTFVFAGRTLEVVAFDGLDVKVRASKKKSATAPKWVGGRIASSRPLAGAMQRAFGAVRTALDAGQPPASVARELRATNGVFEAQHTLGKVPSGERLLIEISTSDEGEHLFVFPFVGYLAHAGLSAVLAGRISMEIQTTLAVSVSDAGFELHAPRGFDFAEALRQPRLFSAEHILEDAEGAVNTSEMARRSFRQVARVAGLVFEGYPGARKTGRQMQTSSGLLFDVFNEWEPENLLLQQARNEVMYAEFDIDAVRRVLSDASEKGVEVVHTERPSPLAFPLTVERVEARVSTESARKRLERMKESWIRATMGPT